MDIRECLIIRTDGCLKQPFPKAAAFGPTRFYVPSLLGCDAIYVRRSQLDDDGGDRRGHPEDQIERARHRAANRPSVYQDFTDEGHQALVVRPPGTVRGERVLQALACALPPFGT